LAACAIPPDSNATQPAIHSMFLIIIAIPYFDADCTAGAA
jgi:hypothetical protein